MRSQRQDLKEHIKARRQENFMKAHEMQVRGGGESTQQSQRSRSVNAIKLELANDDGELITGKHREPSPLQRIRMPTLSIGASLRAARLAAQPKKPAPPGAGAASRMNTAASRMSTMGREITEAEHWEDDKDEDYTDDEDAEGSEEEAGAVMEGSLQAVAPSPGSLHEQHRRLQDGPQGGASDLPGLSVFRRLLGRALRTRHSAHRTRAAAGDAMLRVNAAAATPSDVKGQAVVESTEDVETIPEEAEAQPPSPLGIVVEEDIVLGASKLPTLVTSASAEGGKRSRVRSALRTPRMSSAAPRKSRSGRTSSSNAAQRGSPVGDGSAEPSTPSMRSVESLAKVVGNLAHMSTSLVAVEGEGLSGSLRAVGEPASRLGSRAGLATPPNPKQKWKAAVRAVQGLGTAFAYQAHLDQQLYERYLEKQTQQSKMAVDDRGELVYTPTAGAGLGDEEGGEVGDGEKRGGPHGGDAETAPSSLDERAEPSSAAARVAPHPPSGSKPGTPEDGQGGVDARRLRDQRVYDATPDPDLADLLFVVSPEYTRKRGDGKETEHLPALAVKAAAEKGSAEDVVPSPTAAQLHGSSDLSPANGDGAEESEEGKKQKSKKRKKKGGKRRKGTDGENKEEEDDDDDDDGEDEEGDEEDGADEAAITKGKEITAKDAAMAAEAGMDLVEWKESVANQELELRERTENLQQELAKSKKASDALMGFAKQAAKEVLASHEQHLEDVKNLTAEEVVLRKRQKAKRRGVKVLNWKTRRRCMLKLRCYARFLTVLRTSQDLHYSEWLCQTLRVSLTVLRTTLPMEAFRATLTKDDTGAVKKVKGALKAVLGKQLQKEDALNAVVSAARYPLERMLGTALVMAFMDLRGIVDRSQLAEKMRLAGEASWEYKGRPFEFFVSAFKCMLTLEEQGWFERSTLWGLVFLQSSDGSFSLNAGLATLLSAGNTE
ncbi:hypothetical protein CYMTET_31736, partial [Cymbomonas tetramitiformis]